MCGIVGAFRHSGPVLESLIEGLRTLEYRGYDSVGVGGIEAGRIVVRRRAGRVDDLLEVLADGALKDVSVGIGHSRWATHGPPTDENAHPHCDTEQRLCVVHNGIIENYASLREGLKQDGVVFTSDTDTEVMAHLIGRELKDGRSLAEAVRSVLKLLTGYYALAVLTNEDRPQMVCARSGPPLCVAITADGAYLASDALAILPHTRDVVFLEDGDLAELSPGRINIWDADGQPMERAVNHIEWTAEAADRAGYEHFMLKEIHEQPEVFARCIQGRALRSENRISLEGDFFQDERLRQVERMLFLACGTALHAGLVGSYMIEGLAGIPVDVDYASEFRYRNPPLAKNTVAIGISQSGETADTLAALRLAREMGCAQIAICNSQGSTMVRESDACLMIEAGPEIGVASTKAFSTMVTTCFLLALRMGRARGRIDDQALAQHLEHLYAVRPALEALLSEGAVQRMQEVAERYQDKKGFLFIGRGLNFPIALEGALKLKEISYMHAEGYPAGEMKHGPIAMIEPDLPTVVLAPNDKVADKVRSNIEQVRARGGLVICIGNDPEALALADEAIEVPDVGPWLSPLLNVVPLQLFSYYVAKLRGCDIDKPRNLAKSVTVE